MLKKPVVIAFLLIFWAVAAYSATYYVGPGGSNANDGSSSDNAWKTLTYAVSQMSAGDALSVDSGIYSAAIGEVFPITINQALSFTGGFSGVSGEPTSIVVITSEATETNGFNINVSSGSVEFYNMAFRLDNTNAATTPEVFNISGGSVELGTTTQLRIYGSGKITGVVVSGEGSVTIDGVLFKDLQTAVDFSDVSEAQTVSECTFAVGQTGIRVSAGSSSTITVKHCIFYRYGNGISSEGTSATVNVSYSDFFGNTNNYTTGKVNAGSGIIYEDPNFVSTLEANYNLQTTYGGAYPNHSPCIDAGDPNDTSYVYEPEPNGGVVNLGHLGASYWAERGLSGPSQIDYQDVYFMDTNTGFIVGDYGTLLKTTDGGTTWTTKECATVQDLTRLSGAGTSHVFACGWMGTVIHSANSGEAWEAQTTGLTWHSLEGIHCNTVDNVLAVGEGGGNITTNDGGTSWESFSPPTAVGVDIHFVDLNTGWFIGSGSVIGKTIDGGSGWTTQTSPVSKDLVSVFAAGDNEVWIVGADGTILATTNGGSSWSSQTSGVTAGLQDLYFRDTSTGWVVGSSGTILKTTDGGSSWEALTSGTTQQLNGVYFISSQEGFSVGDNRTIIHTIDSGTNWTIVTPEATSEASSPTASIEITAPNGGEEWDAGSAHNITWTSTGEVNGVRLEYSINDFNAVTTIAAETADDGTYAWTVPEDPSTNVKVRITATNDATVTDTSAAAFTISSDSLITYGQILCYPTPWKLLTDGDLKIAYYLQTDTDTRLFIYSTSGEIVYSGRYASGSNGGASGYNEITWNGWSSYGTVIGNGIYLIKLVSGNRQLAKGHLVVMD